LLGRGFGAGCGDYYGFHRSCHHQRYFILSLRGELLGLRLEAGFLNASLALVDSRERKPALGVGVGGLVLARNASALDGTVGRI
jgi:hypothetical protein